MNQCVSLIFQEWGEWLIILQSVNLSPTCCSWTNVFFFFSKLKILQNGWSVIIIQRIAQFSIGYLQISTDKGGSRSNRYQLQSVRLSTHIGVYMVAHESERERLVVTSCRDYRYVDYAIYTQHTLTFTNRSGEKMRRWHGSLSFLFPTMLPPLCFSRLITFNQKIITDYQTKN